MAPASPARHGPLVRRLDARIKRGAQIIQPLGRDRSAKQGIAVSVELLVVNHGSHRGKSVGKQLDGARVMAR